MRTTLLFAAALLLSACVDRPEPERPIAEVPDNELVSVSYSRTSDVIDERTGTYTVVVSLSRPAPANTTLAVNVTGDAASLIELPTMPMPVDQGAEEVSFDLRIRDNGVTEAQRIAVLTLDAGFNTRPAEENTSLTLQVLDQLPTLRFEKATGLAAEDDGSYSVTLLFDAPAPADGQITLATSGTINPVTDLSGFSATLPYTAGADRLVLTLTLVDDGFAEPPETLTLTIESNSIVKPDPDHAVHTMTLIDRRPTLSFSLARSFSVEDSIRNDLRIVSNIPAPVPIPVALSHSGTATFGVDIEFPEQPVIPAGATSLVLPVSILDDGVIEGAESLTLTLASVPQANVDDTKASHTFYILSDTPLNDTGVTGYATATANNASASPSNAPGQDAAFGRDARAGRPAFDFIKLDAHGNPLPSASSEWACVRDNVAGKIWEIKVGYTQTPNIPPATDDNPNPNSEPIQPWQMRSYNFRFTWYDTDDTINGGQRGAANVDENMAEETPQSGECAFPSRAPLGPSTRDYPAYCNTEVYVKENNAFAFCGRANWRMPTISELQSFASYNPSADPVPTQWFEPEALPYPVLSATTVPGAPATVYCLNPQTRTIQQCLKNVPGFVRLVSDLRDQP